MKDRKAKPLLKRIISWIAWVLTVQLILLNISSAFYAYKFTHLYPSDDRSNYNYKSENILKKTWRIFSGPKIFKSGDNAIPSFPFVSILLQKDKTSLHAWYSMADSAAKGTVILFHGLSGSKSSILNVANSFREKGYNILVPDARSHGENSGSRTTIGYDEAEDVKMAWDYISAKGEKNIYLWGVSMGAVQIIKAAADYELKPKGIIAEMPFQSLYAHMKSRMKTVGLPKQPFSFFTTTWIGIEQGFNPFNFDCTDYARKILSPVLLQCGDKDYLVTEPEMNAIYKNLSSNKKQIVWYKGADHQSLLRYDRALWQQEVDAFLTSTQ